MSRQFEEVIPRYAVSHKPLTTDGILLTIMNEVDILKLQGGETSDEESSFVYPGLDMNGCFDGCMEHWDGEDAADSPGSEKYFELGLLPPRTLSPVGSFYSLLLDQPARKQVPVGPDHQAMLPECEGCQKRRLVMEINRRVMMRKSQQI